MRISVVSASVIMAFLFLCQMASGQISRKEASWVLEHHSDIATKTAEYFKTEYGRTDEGGGPMLSAEFMQLVTTDPSSWRFYSRDRGILIAIDVRHGVSLATLATAPSKIARVAEGIIRQEREMAIANRVMVVFIDPGAHEFLGGRSKYGPDVFDNQASRHDAVGHAWGTIDGVPFSGSFATQPCDCR